MEPYFHSQPFKYGKTYLFLDACEAKDRPRIGETLRNGIRAAHRSTWTLHDDFPLHVVAGLPGKLATDDVCR